MSDEHVGRKVESIPGRPTLWSDGIYDGVWFADQGDAVRTVGLLGERELFRDDRAAVWLGAVAELGELIARQRQLDDVEVDAFLGELRVGLVDSDYGWLRAYRGETPVGSYLSLVIGRKLQDYLRRLWGTWEASVVAQRLGPYAEELDRWVNRDRRPLEDLLRAWRIRVFGAEGSLWGRREPCSLEEARHRYGGESLEEVVRRWGERVRCGDPDHEPYWWPRRDAEVYAVWRVFPERRKERPRVVEWPEGGSEGDSGSPIEFADDTGMTPEERVLASEWSHYHRQVLGAVKDFLASLPPEDARLLLERMRNRKASELARLLGYRSAKQVYRRADRLKARLRKYLEVWSREAGIPATYWEQLDVQLGVEMAEPTVVLGRRP